MAGANSGGRMKYSVCQSWYEFPFNIGVPMYASDSDKKLTHLKMVVKNENRQERSSKTSMRVGRSWAATVTAAKSADASGSILEGSLHLGYVQEDRRGCMCSE